ncbi:NusA N-terminal domain protein [Leptospira interrogans]|nr:NusA N-terminal domain protein [Leptospira interrogans]
MAVKKIQSEGNLLEAIQQFCADKSLDREAVMGVIRDSLITAYKKIRTGGIFRIGKTFSSYRRVCFWKR